MRSLHFVPVKCTGTLVEMTGFALERRAGIEFRSSALLAAARLKGNKLS